MHKFLILVMCFLTIGCLRQTKHKGVIYSTCSFSTKNITGKKISVKIDSGYFVNRNRNKRADLNSVNVYFARGIADDDTLVLIDMDSYLSKKEIFENKHTAFAFYFKSADSCIDFKSSYNFNDIINKKRNVYFGTLKLVKI